MGEFEDIEPKGEYVLIVEGNKNKETEKVENSIEDELLQYINQGLSKNEAIKTVAKNRKLAKNEVYQIALTLNI